jgi:hypothetical protein
VFFVATRVDKPRFQQEIVEWWNDGNIKVNGLNDEYLMSEEAAIKQQLEELKSRVIQLHDGILCLKRCSRLSNLLQKMYEIRVELNQLEQDLLQKHLKCCISSKLRVPAEVAGGGCKRLHGEGRNRLVSHKKPDRTQPTRQGRIQR